MTQYIEYTTLAEVRTSGEGAQLNIATTAADPFLISLIREVSIDIDEIANRSFAPQVVTRLYDVPNNSRMVLDLMADYCEITQVVNGDGSVISPGDYQVYPYNSTPIWALVPKSASMYWKLDNVGNSIAALQVTGVTGFHRQFATAWRSATTVENVGGINASATSITAAAGHGLVAGHLLKIDSEILYLASVSSNTLTVERGANGSTAATHAEDAIISRWVPERTVSAVARQAVAIHWNLRSNPIGQAVSVNGVTFQTPNSVRQWIQRELATARLSRIVFA